MTKARDLADIISDGFTASDIPNLAGEKITSGTVAEARLPSTVINSNVDLTNLSASNLTSGTVADARVPASAVTQHVTGYDDSNVKADILKLAISQAVDGNRVAYNLSDSFIDGFEDDTGITTETTVDRNTSDEYVSTVVSGTTNATGTLISDPQTASSSRTSVSGVIVYEDDSGTATLGTDLKIYFTANNGSNWTEASSYATAVTYSGTKKLVTLGSTTVTSGTQIAMKSVWANQAAPASENQVPEMTSNTAPSGVCSADENNANAYKLFDNSSTSLWTGTTWGTSHSVHYYKYDFGSGTSITATSYKLTGNTNSGSGTNQNPNSWTFEASNDNSNWTTLDSQSSQASTWPSGSYTTKTYTFSNTTAYRYYRWGWTGAGTVASQEVQLSNAEIIGTAGGGKETRLHGWAVNY